jgi:type I restriction enzyme S subunit
MSFREVPIRELEEDGCFIGIQDGNHGEKHPKANDYVDDGVPFVMASDLRNGRVDVTGANKLPQSITDSLRIGFCQGGDVLLSHKGSVGYVAIAPEHSPYLMLTPQVTYYRVNEEKLSRFFLGYAFRDPMFQKRLTNAAGEQGTRGYVGITAQRNLLVRYGDHAQQDRLVEALKPYDDLIENNRRRIELLEDAARLLYREWFVYFRFPGHEHVKVNDGIPRGWRKFTFADVCEAVGGGTPSTDRREYWSDGDIPWYTPTDITRNSCLALLDSEKKITDAGLRGSSAKMLPAGTVLMTSRASVGFFGIIESPSCTNQGFISILPHDPTARMYLMHNLMHRVEEIRSHAGGATYKEISKGKFKALSVVMPERALVHEFETQSAELHSQVRVLHAMNRRLAQARDILLQRLMNGEIEV